MEFRILGPFELVENGRPINVAGGRQRALLALLLVHANEVVASDHLIDGLWGERPPATAQKVLQNAISQLRRTLDDDAIVTRAPGYLLRVDPDAIDAGRFEALLEDGSRMLASGNTEEAATTLREALSLWRGRALDEFAYEPFAQTQIARLEELRLRAIEERIEADLVLGRHADLVGELERLATEHPLRERLRGQLMLALYRSGRQAEALRAYDDGRRVFAAELGLQPGAALQRLEKEILIQDPALEPPHKPEPRRVEATGPLLKHPRGRSAVGLAAIALIAAVFGAAVLLVPGEDAAPAVVPDSLVKIDPDTGEIVDVFRIPAVGFSKSAIVGSYVFVSSTDREILSRVDARSGDVDTFGGVTTSPAGLATGADETLWVGSEEGNKVWQIDADTFELVRVLEIPEGDGPWAIAVGAGSVWISHNRPASVSRFSARTGKLQQRYQHAGSGYSADVAFGAGASWTAANGPPRGRLLRAYAAGSSSESLQIGRIPYAVAVAFDAVWVSDLVRTPLSGEQPAPGQILRLEPTTGIVVEVINVGKRPAGITTGGGSVWVANGGEKTISEIDPRTNRVVKTIPTRYYPGSPVYGHGFLWVPLASQPFSF
jgi:DNA-binding SARP family transcriptional activator/streptogramin lyase